MNWYEECKVPATLVVVVVLTGLTACDPGYGFTIRNPCDAPIRVDARDSDEFARVGIGGAVTMQPHSTKTWEKLDPHITPPFGVLLVDGPRKGELIKSDEPDVTIPQSACPR